MPPLRSRREQWLLALLVLRHDRDTARDWLATTLWPDNEEPQSLFYLRKSLSNIRKALGDEANRLLSPSARTIRLDMTGATADVIAFDAAIVSKKPEEAVALYKGALLPECLEDWAIPDRTQRENAYLGALEQLARTDAERGDPTSATRRLRLLITADPYRESAYTALMQAVAASGDRAAVTVVYRQLQERLLHDLNSAPSPETDALYKELRHQERQTLPTRPSPAQQTKRHLPVPLTDLIGRENEIKEVLSWMKQRRMVTLVGTGGIGKTRLALAIADAALPRFEDGVWFIDLAPLNDPALIPQAAAKVLGIAEQQDRPLKQTIAESLSSRNILLVLDNCEQFTQACAEFAHSLLSNCLALYIVATSREALHIEGEQVLRVPSLAVPPPQTNPSPIEQSAIKNQAIKQPATGNPATEFDAVRLFLDRATRVDSNFKLTPKNAPDIAEICRQLDGIPLAIEMAAARLRSLSTREIKDRLEDRFRLLTSGSRGALPRQQTLRAAIDWSYDHLSDPERSLLQRVSVFAGGWTLEAAKAVASLEFEDKSEIRDPRSEMQDLLDSLVDKSLAIAEVDEESTRYRLLESIKQYAHFHLVENELINIVRAHHLTYFATYALDLRPKLLGADQAHWFSAMDNEHDNFRQALAFSLEQPEQGPMGLKLAGALSRYWLIRGHFSEGREAFGAILSAPCTQARTKDRAIALNGAGLLAWRQSDYKDATARYAESISIARELGDKADLARALNNLALITRDQGDYDSAGAMHEESIALLQESGEKVAAAICLPNLGVIYHYKGHFAKANATFEQGLALQREMGERNSTSATLNSLGAVALDQNDHETARLRHQEGLQISKELEDKYGIASHTYGLACAALQRGDLEEAWSLLQQSLPAMAALGEKTLVTDQFGVLATLAQKSHRDHRAATLLGAQAALRDATGSPLPSFARERIDRQIAAVKESLGESQFCESWDVGLHMSLDQAIEYGLSA